MCSTQTLDKIYNKGVPNSEDKAAYPVQVSYVNDKQSKYLFKLKSLFQIKCIEQFSN